MPKNTKGGKGHKRAKKIVHSEEKIQLILKEEGQEYATVIRALGNGRIEVRCFDGVTRLAHMRGNLKRKKMFINVGDVILISLRDYQNDKADVIHGYKIDEARKLKSLGELPDNIEFNTEVNELTDESIPFDFENI